MNLSDFSRKNRERCESPEGFNHKLTDWSLSDWMTALMGELGEAANVAKKLNRIRDGIPGNPMVRVCPACKATWRHDSIQIQKCSCGQMIDDVAPVPNLQLEVELREKLGRELADTFIYLDLTFQRLGLDFGQVVAEVFNAKSEQIGSPVRVEAD